MKQIRTVEWEKQERWDVNDTNSGKKQTRTVAQNK